jgi:hypothetical protein
MDMGRRITGLDRMPITVAPIIATTTGAVGKVKSREARSGLFFVHCGGNEPQQHAHQKIREGEWWAFSRPNA